MKIISLKSPYEPLDIEIEGQIVRTAINVSVDGLLDLAAACKKAAQKMKSLETLRDKAQKGRIFNLKARSRKAIGFVNSIPILNGDIITGISLFLLFVSLGITQGYTTVVLAHITFCTPYVVLSVLPRLKQMNPNIYEAALDLGATPMQALWKVIIPEIRPGMISGFMLALTLSIDDFAVTVFTIGNQGLETLSTYIYADARKGGLTPELRPLSAIIFVVVLALLVVINYRAGKTKKKD